MGWIAKTVVILLRYDSNLPIPGHTFCIEDCTNSNKSHLSCGEFLVVSRWSAYAAGTGFRIQTLSTF